MPWLLSPYFFYGLRYTSTEAIPKKKDRVKKKGEKIKKEITCTFFRMLESRKERKKERKNAS